MIFFTGLHQPSDAHRLPACCISIHRLERRRKPVPGRRVLGDSGAFTKLNKFGGYPETPAAYAAKVARLHRAGIVRYLAIVAEDYMCEPFVVARTGLSIAEHQRLTVERYDALVDALHVEFEGPPPFRVMPVLQGQSIADYLRHIEMYGARLTPRMWVGVGSVCKRQGNVAVIEDLLSAIKEVRPDVRLHGFRREVDRAAKPYRAAVAVQRRQHGLEFCGHEGRAPFHQTPQEASRSAREARRGPPADGAGGRGRSGSERLARGEGLRRPSCSRGAGRRTAPPAVARRLVGRVAA